MHNILVTGGIGDLHTLESHWSPESRESLDTIYYCCRGWRQILPLWEKIFPHVHMVNLAPDDVWDRTWAFFSHPDVLRRLPHLGGPPAEEVGRLLLDVHDWSILVIFPFLANQAFYGSALLNTKLADVEGYGLPEDYAVVHPYTSFNRAPQRNIRDFKPSDWDYTRRWLQERQLTGVVLNVGLDHVPDDFLDLSNRTTLSESVEIMKHAKGYCGIDSSLCQLAAQLFRPPMIDVLSRNSHFYQNKHLYLRTDPPFTDFGFLHGI